MDAVLLEKAETQQMLVLLRKENETLRNQSEVSWTELSMTALTVLYGAILTYFPRQHLRSLRSNTMVQTDKTQWILLGTSLM